MVLLLDPVMEFVFVLYCGFKYILAALKSLHVVFNFIQQLYTGTILLNRLDTIIHITLDQLFKLFFYRNTCIILELFCILKVNLIAYNNI